MGMATMSETELVVSDEDQPMIFSVYLLPYFFVLLGGNWEAISYVLKGKR